MGTGYAVIDVETTGLSPGRHHRVVEVAVVLTDARGRVTDEWCTLVNPERDLGPQHIHGVSAAEARTAPRFADIAGQVVRLLAGRVLVGHNVSFDARFLEAEFARLDVELLMTRMPALCTMRLAEAFLTTAGRSLAACCEAAGIEAGTAHSALHDARATAGLLARYLDLADVAAEVVREAAGWPWPELPCVDVRTVARGQASPPEQHFLARLVGLLPRVARPKADEYLAVLDLALVDRHVSRAEQDELLETARDLGLGLPEVLALHRAYLADLADAAWADHVVTDAEAADLRLVASLLGVDGGEVGVLLEPGGRVRLAAGDGVVFTGQTREPRDVLEARATAAGLVVVPGVSKRRTRVVVAADPDTMSGKAAKARAFGIPVVSEQSFAGLLSGFTPPG
ncbi:exonuclease domain-containing protein [Actinokineospora guangxiensis]|uniref:Exonuclease domain-containing protein n=1 Tax=Actinokineospora guangxiensis TaxID=1490288 RepID=A0ABW0ENF9_9PSEU